jgi:hypothetical protein
MAWAKGSSLYNSLIIAMPDLEPEINSLEGLPATTPSKKRAWLFISGQDLA